MDVLPAPRIGVIVVAAGNGTRLGHAEPKAFVELRGVTILERALQGALDAVEPPYIVLVVPSGRLAFARTIADRADGAVSESIAVVEGGATRQESVARGLAALPPHVEIVLVHDAARALTPGALFDRVARAVEASAAGVVPALPVTDTVKRIGAGDRVLETVDRRDLVHVQTPQGFPRVALDDAYAAAVVQHTDDAALFAAAGGAVSVVEGEARAFKITTPWDLRRAESVLGARDGFRTGVGIDVHAYDDGTPLWLGGLYWPDEPGLAGHSDGDAVLHAICDALLSASGLGDLGSRFGIADSRYAGAASEVFVRETLALVSGAGFEVANVAVQVVGAHPKVSPRRSELEARLSDLVGAPVSVGATTTDGLGFAGRGEGLSVVATALLSSP